MSDDPFQFVERDTIGGWSRVNHDVEWRCAWQQQYSAKLTKPSLQSIPVDCGFAVLRNDEADAGVVETRKGSDSPNVEMFGSESLPCSCDAAQLRAERDPASALERLGLTRRRTCSGAGR